MLSLYAIVKDLCLLCYTLLSKTVSKILNIITFSFARRNISPISECCEADSGINFGATLISSTCEWIYTQEYRSGHNEAVLKTVCPKGTGVRIPLPAPKNKDTPCGCPLFFATVRGSQIRSPSELARRWVRIWAVERVAKRRESDRKQLSVVFPRAWPNHSETKLACKRQGEKSSPLVNTPLPSKTSKKF